MRRHSECLHPRVSLVTTIRANSTRVRQQGASQALTQMGGAPPVTFDINPESPRQAEMLNQMVPQSFTPRNIATSAKYRGWGNLDVLPPRLLIFRQVKPPLRLRIEVTTA